MSIAWKSDPSAPVEIAVGPQPISAAQSVFRRNPRRRRKAHARIFSFRRRHPSLARRLARKSRDGPRRHRRLQPRISFFSFFSGPFLWLPRTWTRAAVRAGTRLKFSLRGKARDFNWHNVIGFWTCIPLAVIVLCAVVMSYPWANNLVYKMTGNPPPPPNAQQQAGASSQANGQRNRNRDDRVTFIRQK